MCFRAFYWYAVGAREVINRTILWLWCFSTALHCAKWHPVVLVEVVVVANIDPAFAKYRTSIKIKYCFTKNWVLFTQENLTCMMCTHVLLIKHDTLFVIYLLCSLCRMTNDNNLHVYINPSIHKSAIGEPIFEAASISCCLCLALSYNET